MSQCLSEARHVLLASITSIIAFATYRAHTDPLHLFWDLDHTILCSLSPIPNEEKKSEEKCRASKSSSLVPLPTAPSLKHFDHVDDDFPYNSLTLAPNTRTYLRPGARTALQLCSYFTILYVYTAAQESYTTNIINKLDPHRKIFTKIIHRDEFPAIITHGKDLTVATKRLDRALLFDDRLSNFEPQMYQNGISVVPYTPTMVKNYLSSDNDKLTAYLREITEMARLVSIAFWGSLHWDVRNVVRWIRAWNGDESSWK